MSSTNIHKYCKSCAYCNKVNTNILRCSKCQKVMYCDRNCQQLHWPSHKIFCNNCSHYVRGDNNVIDDCIATILDMQTELEVYNDCGTITITLYDILLGKDIKDVSVVLGRVSIQGGEYVNHLWIEWNYKLIDITKFLLYSTEDIDYLVLQRYKNYIEDTVCSNEFIDLYRKSDKMNHTFYASVLGKI